MRDAIIQRAFDAAGGPSALAKAIGIKVPSLYSWRRIPAERVRDVSRATGIAPEKLRPDLFQSDARRGGTA